MKMPRPNISGAAELLNIGNYCVLFLDLLGQRDLLRGEGLMSSVKDDAINAFHRSLGCIRRLHDHTDDYFLEYINRGLLTVQRWSDGIMVYAPLGKVPYETAAEAIHSITLYAGAMVLIGLAAETPMRGGIDIAWGTELYPGELYGPALANAYFLESEVARYPRIVIGQNAIEFLAALEANAGKTQADAIGRQFAREVDQMCKIDDDGKPCINLLAVDASEVGGEFDKLRVKALEFARHQKDSFDALNDKKHAERYQRLLEHLTPK